MGKGECILVFWVTITIALCTPLSRPVPPSVLSAVRTETCGGVPVLRAVLRDRGLVDRP